jgi:hypothetical protein
LASSQGKGVYTPKRVIPHAALLCQACAHCRKFLAAASRRSRGRVSVPVWLAVLSDQLPITALVGRYPTNQLIGRSPLQHQSHDFSVVESPQPRVCGLSRRFRRVSPSVGQVSHVFLTRPPRSTPEGAPVRLACIRHAASVYPEPGSNSPSRSPRRASSARLSLLTGPPVRWPPRLRESRLSCQGASRIGARESR